MKKLTLDNDVFFLPEKWDDLTKEQLIRIAALSTLGLSPNEFKIYLLVSVLGFTIPKEKRYSLNEETCYRMLNGKKGYLISAPDLAFVCLNSLQFLFTEKVEKEIVNLEIECKLSRTVIDTITVKGEVWHGPGDSLNNILYEEYIRALVSASEYSETKSITALDKLIAALYRPAKKEDNLNGDIRVAFNDFTVDERALLLNKVPEAIKYAVLLQFNGAIYKLSQLFEEAFKPGTGKVKAKNVFFAQLDLVDTLAGHRIPEKEAIRKTQLYDVLHTFNNLIKNKPKK